MKKNIQVFIFIFLDFLFLSLIYILIGYLRNYFEKFGLSSFSLYSIKDFSFALIITLSVLYYEKIYTYRYDFWEETRLILKSLLLSVFLILSLMTITKTGIEYSRTFILMYFFALLFFFPFYKRFSKRILFSFPFFIKRVKVIGNLEQKEFIKKEFATNWYLGIKYSKKSYSSVFIATKDMKIERLNKYLTKLLVISKEVYVLPYLSDINLSQASVLEYFNIRTSVIHINNKLLKKSNILLKESFEKVLIILILPLFLFLHLIISRLIKNDSSGDVLFKQKRFGKKSKVFKCYKYRTMYENSDLILSEYLKDNIDEVEYYEEYHKYKNDPRITKVGSFLRKTSLDELPQILNVLEGHMSLIGPRPYMLSEKEKIQKNISIILNVKPGITGLWQVSGRNDLTFNQRMNLDIWYIQNWSLWMDLVIFVKTIQVVLSKVGAK